MTTFITNVGQLLIFGNNQMNRLSNFFYKKIRPPIINFNVNVKIIPLIVNLLNFF